MSEAHSCLVSFVVPCYNYGRFLRDCLNSIFALEGDYDFEIIAIDDGSTDDTLQILDSFTDKRVKVLRHAVNQGHAQTITDGLREARGEFVARIDPDDRYRACFLRETIPIFTRHPEVGLIHGDAAVIDAEGRLSGVTLDATHNGAIFKGNAYLGLLEKNDVSAPTVIARRELWLRALPLPAGIAFNDWYFNLMIARRCEFYFVPKIFADYRIHGANDHFRILKNKTMEPCIIGLLDQLFSETEESADLERAKQAVRNQVYATQYWSFANDYFASGFLTDARRCYLQTLKYDPAKLLSPAMWRRFAGSFLSPQAYQQLKAMLGYHHDSQ